MLSFILGSILIVFITSLYKRRLVVVLLLISLFITVNLILNSPSFKESYKYAYELTMLLAVLFLHTFEVIAYPLMIKFVLRDNVYTEYFTKGFIWVGTGGSIFALYMFFIKGVIYS